MVAFCQCVLLKRDDDDDVIVGGAVENVSAQFVRFTLSDRTERQSVLLLS